MKIQAILWDGHCRIQGYLESEETQLTFHLLDFHLTNLTLTIPYEEIESIKLYALSTKGKHGIEILSRSRQQHIFILQKPAEIKKKIEQKRKAFS